ncbi:unnamed protein product [Rhizophagus irregularis]|nr:unnamed protein product [Rhizophagus irregularis]CAB5314762.1 unnamed protein product [Rhizophagus irregularis]CAB5394260.1 unnamed protein product [Rhizophagus irregularis]
MSIKQEWDEGSILHRPKMPNKYITFCMFYKKILNEEYPHLKPQEKAAKAGELWRFLPNKLKNSFELYATYENHLEQLRAQNSNTKIKKRPILPYPDFQTVFDSNQETETSHLTEVTVNEDDQIFNEMYNMCINENASL